MITLGLEGISRLLAQTPLTWRAIHVAGTNGKGSICAYVSGMLDVYNIWAQQARQSSPSPADKHLRPIKHGRFTSPHLIDRWDCITINNRPVDADLFHSEEREVLSRNNDNKFNASEFEILTATAFKIFNQEKVDVAIVEVGMGGRLDATNIVGLMDGVERPENDETAWRPAPLVTAIASIGLDHQAFLGDTLTRIAREKAGIIKAGVPVVYDRSNEAEVVNVLREVTVEQGSPNVDWNTLENGSSLKCKEHLDSHIEQHSLPKHVKQNATVAFIAAWTALNRLQVLPSGADSQAADQAASLEQLAQDMLNTIPTTTFPGRQQRISLQSLTGRHEPALLDGAHNAQSAEALAHTVEKLRTARQSSFCSSKVTWVLAASDSKDAREILRPLLKDGDAVFAVEFGEVDGMPWVKALSIIRLLEAARGVTEGLEEHECGGDVRRALQEASDAAAGGPLVIAGSLYLVGDVLRVLRDG